MRQMILRFTAFFLSFILFGAGAWAAAKKRPAAKSGSAGGTAAKKQTAAKKPGTATKTASPAAHTPSAATGKRASAAKKSVSAKRGSARTRRGAAQRKPTGPSAERISQIQTALAAGGYYQGQPNGRLDAATAAALSRFQQAKNLEVTGKLSVRTVKELERYGLPATTYAAGNSPAKAGTINP